MKHFTRDAYGVWRCMTPASLPLPSGQVDVMPGTVFTRGTRFLNVDLAVLLDEQYAKEREDGPPV